MQSIRRYYISFILLLFMCNIAYTQSLCVRYRSVIDTSWPGLFKESGLDDDLRRGVISAYKGVNFYYLLLCNTGNSIFSLEHTEPQTIELFGYEVNMDDVQSATVYKDYNSGDVLTQTPLLGKTYLVHSKIQDSGFVINNEKKMIKGYLCYKIVREDGAWAWITKMSPISDGPFLSNFEGLVIEARVDGYFYYFEDISISPEINISKPESGIYIEKDEFQELTEKIVAAASRK